MKPARLTTLEAASFRPFAHRPALLIPGESTISYQELSVAVTAFAVRLSAAGVRPGNRVGVQLPKSFVAVTALLAILRVKAVCVPIEVGAPVIRSDRIFAEAGVALIVTSPGNAASAGTQLNVEARLPGPTAETILLKVGNKDTTSIYPPDLAYILYTSGSTGFPKGVMLTHENMACFVTWATDRFALVPGDVLSSIAPLHFDLSIFDLFAGLTAGATVLLCDAATVRNPLLLAAQLADHRASVVYATPTLLQLLLQYGKLAATGYTGPTRLLYAGEIFPPSALHELRKQWPEAEVYNLYGPTETNVVTAYHVPRTFHGAAIPIGTDCPYAECRLWDGGFLAPEPGAEGELWVAGSSVAAGYVGEDKHPSFTEVAGKCWYKTGDWVRLDPAGRYVFLGRRDRMIKRNGNRVEPAEIERCLGEHPAVAAAAVLPVKGKKARRKLLAIITLRPGAGVPDREALRAYCLDRLPVHFLPDGFRVVDELPLTASHKTDYSALERTFSAS